MRTFRTCLLMLGCVVAAGAVARADGVWTPETGEVNVEEMPRHTPEQRREYAFALLGVGQWREGLRILRAQMQEAPEAEWVPRARLSIARALLDGNRARRAFELLDQVEPERVDPAILESVRDLQFEAARVRARQSLGGAHDMLDRMMEYMETDEERAYVMKEKADVSRLAGDYLDAMSRYMDAIDAYPRSTWVPYNEYGLALAQWDFARWLNLGLEDVAGAERSFADFLEMYPAHPLAPEARRELQQARRKRWNMYSRVAEFYAQQENRSWAALQYLRHMLQEVPDAPAEQVRQAERKAERYDNALARPLPGQTWQLDATGLVTSQTRK